MQFFAREVQQGTKLAGVLSMRDLAPYRSNSSDDLQKTQPFAVNAAPGYAYMLLDIVTAGNNLSPYLVVVNTAESCFDGQFGATSNKEAKIVYKLGRS